MSALLTALALAASPEVVEVVDGADVRWTRTYTAEDHSRVYPSSARAAAEEGRVRLRCRVVSGGALRRCQVVQETPERLGFGAAAIVLAHRMKVDLSNAPIEGKCVEFPMRFDIYGMNMNVEPFRLSPSPIWAEAPTRAQVLAANPKGLKGLAVLNCRVTDDGRLSRCYRTRSTTSSLGAAALQLARHFRVAPEGRLGAGRGVETVEVPIAFDLAEIVDASYTALRGVEGRDVRGRGAWLRCDVGPLGAMSGCADETGASVSLPDAVRLSAWTDDGRPVDGATVRLFFRHEDGAVEGVDTAFPPANSG